MSAVVDKSLLESVRNGSREAFDVVFDATSNAVYANILKFVRHPEDAEDILQEVYIALWEKRTFLRADTSLAGWLAVVSHNKALNFLQQKVRQKLKTDAMEWVAETVPAEEPDDTEKVIEQHLALLAALINRLPTRKKQAFTLCRLQGKTYREAALLLGISQHTVKEYVQNATQQIKWNFPDTAGTPVVITIMLLDILNAL